MKNINKLLNRHKQLSIYYKKPLLLVLQFIVILFAVSAIFYSILKATQLFFFGNLTNKYYELYNNNKDNYNSILILEHGALNLIDRKSINTLIKDANKGITSAILMLSFSNIQTKYQEKNNIELSLSKKTDEALVNAIYANKMYKGDGIKKDITQSLILMSQKAEKNSFTNIKMIINTFDYDYPLFCDYAKKGYELFGLTAYIDIIIEKPKKLYEIEKKCKIFNLRSHNNKLIANIFNDSEHNIDKFFNALYLIHHGSIVKAEKILNELMSIEDKVASANAKYCLGYIKNNMNNNSGDTLILEASKEGVIDFKTYEKQNMNKYDRGIINYPGTSYCKIKN